MAGPFLVFVWHWDSGEESPSEIGAESFMGGHPSLDTAKASLPPAEEATSAEAHIAEFDGERMHILATARIEVEERYHTETRQQWRSPTVVIEQTGRVFDGYVYRWVWADADEWIPGSS